MSHLTEGYLGDKWVQNGSLFLWRGPEGVMTCGVGSDWYVFRLVLRVYVTIWLVEVSTVHIRLTAGVVG